MRPIFCIICNGQPYAQLYIGVRIKKGQTIFNPGVYWLCESHLNDHSITTVDALNVAKAFGVRTPYQLLSPCCRRPSVYINIPSSPLPTSLLFQPSEECQCRCGKRFLSKQAIVVSTVPTRKEKDLEIEEKDLEIEN